MQLTFSPPIYVMGKNCPCGSEKKPNAPEYLYITASDIADAVRKDFDAAKKALKKAENLAKLRAAQLAAFEKGLKGLPSGVAKKLRDDYISNDAKKVFEPPDIQRVDLQIIADFCRKPREHEFVPYAGYAGGDAQNAILAASWDQYCQCKADCDRDFGGGHCQALYRVDVDIVENFDDGRGDYRYRTDLTSFIMVNESTYNALI